jgi:hypothetical protein
LAVADYQKSTHDQLEMSNLSLYPRLGLPGNRPRTPTVAPLSRLLASASPSPEPQRHVTGAPRPKSEAQVAQGLPEKRPGGKAPWSGMFTPCRSQNARNTRWTPGPVQVQHARLDTRKALPSLLYTACHRPASLYTNAAWRTSSPCRVSAVGGWLSPLTFTG